MFKKTNEMIQDYLKDNPIGDTYPSGMSRFFNILEDGDWTKIYDEISTFAQEGDSDIRFKLRKVLKEISKDEFAIQMNIIIAEFKKLNNNEEATMTSIHKWYQQIRNMEAFKLLDKRVGNGIPNAMLNRIKSAPQSQGHQSYFSLRCGSKNEYYNDFINNKFISITWNNLGDISSHSYDQLVQYGIDKYDSKMSGSMFSIFRDTMNIGDIVLIIQSGTKAVQLAVITSDMQYDESLPSYYSNYRTIEVIKKDVEFDFVYRIQSTITTIYNENRQTIIKDQLDEETMNKYNDVMASVDTDRNFVFEFLEEENGEDDLIEYLNDHKQLIIDGAPGTGKSYGVNTEVKENNINHERVTFYSDYEYHNFIGSILPKLNGETVTYEFVKGPFTKILNDALSRPEDKHYLIIEELTRGNAAAIFGDIFQLLDRTEEGWSEYPITHDNILESLDPEVRTFLENKYGGKVVLPPNLSIICTINSSDQNVYPLDTAFKRRFDYKIESTNVHDNFVDYDIKFGTDITVSWQDFYQKLNEYILIDLGLKEDKQVGPYFIKNHKGDNKKLESIQTKLAMYMWNDLHKVHTISNKSIFKDVHTLYEVDNLFRTGFREQILEKLSDDFKQHFNLNDSSVITE